MPKPDLRLAIAVEYNGVKYNGVKYNEYTLGMGELSSPRWVITGVKNKS